MIMAYSVSLFLIQAVKDKAVSPDHDGNQQRSQSQSVVSLNNRIAMNHVFWLRIRIHAIILPKAR